MLDLTVFLNAWVYPTLALILTGLVTWLVLRSQGWLQAHAQFLDAKTREKMTALEQTALNEGVQYVMAYAQRQGAQVHPVVNSWLLRQGAQVAINHASGILADNNMSPDDVANKILAKLPDVVITTDVNAAVTFPLDGGGHIDFRPLLQLTVPATAN